jgi:hypothetical protein
MNQENNNLIVNVNLNILTNLDIDQTKLLILYGGAFTSSLPGIIYWLYSCMRIQ